MLRNEHGDAGNGKRRRSMESASTEPTLYTRAQVDAQVEETHMNAAEQTCAHFQAVIAAKDVVINELQDQCMKALDQQQDQFKEAFEEKQLKYTELQDQHLALLYQHRDLLKKMNNALQDERDRFEAAL